MSVNEPSTNPTVVLVHGAFADASGWAGVITDLQSAGLTVLAPPNPLRSLASDAAYIASVATQIDGPVLLAGHSYGGAVISVAAAHAPNVVGLVYVNAFALDEGDSVLDILSRFPETPLRAALRRTTFPVEGATEPGGELSIDPALFRNAFAGDVPVQTAAVMAVAQRPISELAFGEKAKVAGAWKSLPSWYAVATMDNSIHPEAQRFMAQRAGAETIELDGSHTDFVGPQATAVAGLIRRAVASVSNRPTVSATR